MRKETQLIDDWEFSERPLTLKDTIEFCDDFEWSKISIPHDWLIFDTNQLYRNSEGWYKRKFYIDDIRQVSLMFEGVYPESDIYVNRSKVATHKNGYTSFDVDITPFCNIGGNELIVHVVHRSPNSRWYSGAGIYRKVWLIEKDAIHIIPNGIYLYAVPLSENEWELNVEIKLSREADSIYISCYLDDLVHKGKYSTNNFCINISWKIINPNLWSPETPYLYQFGITLDGERFSDSYFCQFGFKSILFDSDIGMLLNGKPIKIKGICLHHDLGLLGSAVHRSAIRRQLMLMKEMGANAIRTAHNPAATELLELADELGFLVQSEFTDVWKHSKTPYDYSIYFDKYFKKDVKDWICRDRNHVSVFMWSIGNEIYDTHGREDGLNTALELIDLVKQYDSHENAKITFGSNYLLWENTQKVADYLKLVGYNYGEELYEEHHKRYPDWIIYGSETISIVSSRGVYHFPVEEKILSDDDLQTSSLGNSTTSWGSKDLEKSLLTDIKTPYSLGQFIWAGIDYLGEPTPYHTKNSYLGQVDTAGFPKDAYFLIKSIWNSEPMIHLYPYWDFSKGQKIDVGVVSNLHRVEVRLDDQLMFEQVLDEEDGSRRFQAMGKIKYQKGKLSAYGYDKTNQLICEQHQESFTEPIKLLARVEPVSFLFKDDESVILYIDLEVIDELGHVVANANNTVHVSDISNVKILGLDNGDATDFTQYVTLQKRLFNGKLLCMAQVIDMTQPVRIIFESEGLYGIKLLIDIFTRTVETCELKQLNVVQPKLIRKIELVSQDISQNDQSFEVEASVLPSDARTQVIEWRVTDSKGIDSNIVDYSIKDNKMRITPIADGTFYVRAGIKNDKNHIDRYSMLDFELSGYGSYLLNPYQPISGGLYSRSNVELTSGNERGVATLRDETCYVIFDNVNFGLAGADRLTLSLFPLEGNRFPIEVWKGVPTTEDAQLIEIIFYDKGSIWNTYQEQTYQLSKRLYGVQTISFVFKQKVHMKEFLFHRCRRQSEVIRAIEYDSLYGDSYEVIADAIVNIGNNVTLAFDEFDFKDTTNSVIKINGKTSNHSNSILIKRLSKDKEYRDFIEITQSDEYQWTEHHLVPINDLMKIELIFLPGSNFNLKSFILE
ncbi:glycoside hydrolase family 2 TIM barrel-domain containing protein [Streptococcus sp. S784/96/1]|uniref:glycoside hydrolase family 2 TIM barrel-domain containing protein n=1 Tax=Streptococcus sp. S784/96/1 TaxID=2653499 RepID=UPI0013866A7D|nr:glycoside hydrolase family 2 TIM barrel-domain containing protein [Streptococcus sp. S784/96/1]